MVRSYIEIIKAKKHLINKEIFNIGSTNHKVMDIAGMVKDIIGQDVILKKFNLMILLHYHISSEKIKKKLNFETKLTISDAVSDLKKGF